MKLLVASGNPKKARELTERLASQGVAVVTPREVGGLPEVVEDGDTFAANAAKKARSGARASGLWTLADDSGLEVEALGGAPGVRSARYAAFEGSEGFEGRAEGNAADADNNAKLLRELAGLPPEQRRARFVCALALARPDGELAFELEGTAAGRILAEPRGASGFGYDPLFLFDEPGDDVAAWRGHTFAELSSEEKSVVSHRGRALARLAQRLPALLAPSHRA